MSSTVKLDENYFTCSVCNDEYSDPRFLPCLHSFCRNCLAQHIVYSGKTTPPSFLCPVCRKLVLVQDEGKSMHEWVEFFPANFLLKDLMSQSRKPEDEFKVETKQHDPTICLHHTNKKLCMFCISCELPACEVCINTTHRACELVTLETKNTTDQDNLLSCVEKLENEIDTAQMLSSQSENEQAYLLRQKEKVISAIENHATKFRLMVDRARKNLFTEVEGNYQQLKQDIDIQLSLDSARLKTLQRLNSDAKEVMQIAGVNLSNETSELTKKINKALVCPTRPRCERMRATFTPDYSNLAKELSIGSVTFYNARLLASDKAAPLLPRSQSYVQLSPKLPKNIASSDFRVQRRNSGPVMQQTDGGQRPCSAPVFEKTDTLHSQRLQKYSSIPDLQNDFQPQILFSVSHTQNNRRSDELLLSDQPATPEPNKHEQNGESVNSFVATEYIYFKTNEYRKHDGELPKHVDNPPPSPQSAANRQSFLNSFGDEEELSSFKKKANSQELKTSFDNMATYVTNKQSSVHTDHVAKQFPVVQSRINNRFSLASDDDKSTPVITSIIVLSDWITIIAADSANKSLKIWRKKNPCFTIKLTNTPFGLAASSENRIVVSLPESKELTVISTEKTVKIMSTMLVQRSYGKLMPYRSGITAAACAEEGCIDLVSLQGKVMKQFRVFQQPVNEISFWVDPKQEVVVWDPVEFSVVTLSKSGTKRVVGKCEALRDKKVTGLACDASDLIYIINDGWVAMVTRKGDYCGDLDNILSCEAMCITSSGTLYVVQSEGEGTEVNCS